MQNKVPNKLNNSIYSFDINLESDSEEIPENGAYSCYSCKTPFTCRRNLEYHIAHNVCVRLEHDKEKQTEIAYRTCFLCNPKKIMSSRLSMRTHLRKIHQIGKISDYQKLVSKAEQWSVEVTDDWGNFVCRDNRWTNKAWINERWEYLLSSENMFSENWTSILSVADTKKSFQQKKMEIFDIIDDLLIKFLDELPNSPFNEMYSLHPDDPANSVESADPANSLSDPDSGNTATASAPASAPAPASASYLTEMVWMEFFASLPTTNDIWMYVMNGIIRLSRQLKSPYLIKKWFYPIYYWILWLRWNHFMNYKTHWKSFRVEEWIHLYTSLFDLHTYLPKNHFLSVNIQNEMSNNAENAENDENVQKKNGNYFMSFD